MVEPLLRVENLKVHFPVARRLFSRTPKWVYAVDDVSFQLNKGETIGIVGESGCGKTTTGKAIVNLIEPTGGRVVFQGQDITHLRKMPAARQKAVRKAIQIVFQDPYSSLNPRMTVKQLLDGPLRIHKRGNRTERQERVTYLMEKVGLSPDQSNRYPHQFSGGQRQRIGIARALTLGPQLIVGDEPVSALDVSIQAQIINLLMDLQQAFELSYVIIAHDIGVIAHIADRVVVMYLGKIVEIGLTQDVFTTPLHPYTQALLSAVPVADPRAKQQRILLKGDVPSPLTPPTGCAFHPRCRKAMEACSKHTPALGCQGERQSVACLLYSRDDHVKEVRK